MKKTVSIIVPMFKSEPFLQQLLDSIIKQTYSNLEIILVDDGSPDKSGEIADQYARADSRVTVIHKANGGTCEARNYGLRVATGDYLMFADGDDWFELDCVEYLVRLLEDSNASMSMTDAVFTTDDRIQNDEDHIRLWTNKEAVAGIINTFIIPVGPWNKLYSMDIIRENKLSFSVPWFGEGLFFSTMAAQYSSEVAVGHRKVYNYRLNNPNSGCAQMSVQNALNSLENIMFIKDSLTIESKEISHAIDWHIWTNCYYLIVNILASDAVGEYGIQLDEARRMMRQKLPQVLQHGDLKADKKAKAIVKTVFPILFAKRTLDNLPKRV